MDGSFYTLPRGPRRLAFFCPDVTEASTLTRARQFIDQGYEVTVFGFRRARYNSEYYRRNWDDPVNYHITINTGVLGFDGATEVVVGRARALGWVR